MTLLVVLALIIIIGLVYWLFFSSYSQLFGRFPYRQSVTKKVVALTFDDGPNEPFTSQLADLLAKEQVKATFFQVGACVKKYPAVSKRLYGDGHVIGNHSLSHSFGKYFRQPSFKSEITATQQIIEQTIGRRPALFRPPWLFRTPWLLRSLRQQRLQVVSGVFCHPREPWQPAAERIARRTLKKIRPGSIIIFHDGFDAKGGNRAQTVLAVKLVITALKDHGYQFTTVDQLLDVPAYQN